MSSGDKTYLITGVGSGLGKFLYENIPDGLGLTRLNKEEVFDAAAAAKNLNILHCAFNSNRKIKDHYQYLQDNIILTAELLAIPHSRFVYFSSVDIYKEPTSYSFTKKVAESYVSARARNPLILRLSALLGPTIRRNSLLRILEGSELLTLSGDSSFNYILQSDILSLLKSRSDDEIKGIYNFISSKNITLREVSEYYGKDVVFGDFKYITISETHAATKNINPKGNRTSLETVKEFLRGRYE